MHLLLTQFYMYLEIIVLQDKHEYMGKYTKRHFLTKHNAELHKGIIQRPINLDYLGAKPPVEQPRSSPESITRRRW